MTFINQLTDIDRVVLIRNISNVNGFKDVNSAVWASLWFADVTKLRQILEKLKSPENQDLVKKINSAADNLRFYANLMDTNQAEIISEPGESARSNKRKADSISRPTPDRPSKITRLSLPKTPANSSTSPLQDEAQASCLERDLAACVISHTMEPVAPTTLYPDHLTEASEYWNKAKTEKFWVWAEMLWSFDTVQRWKDIISGSSHGHTCSSLITMSRDARELWRRARFVLKPVKPSSDPKHQILLDTKNPEKLPLPSMEILEMQMIFNPLIAVSGRVD
ncbi:uncharacterized protein BDV14DRAFT_199751 [Aspergillus stella-maris]|uniref:uncharacterized protein n=1 Tax=Aspergillus stella-maris TaxID=1810926 RepID=UPI003CCD74A0